MSRFRVFVMVCLFVSLCVLPTTSAAGLLEDGERALATDDLVAAEAAFKEYSEDDSNPPDLRAEAFRGVATARHYMWMDASGIEPLCRSLILDPQSIMTASTTEYIRDAAREHGCDNALATYIEDITAAAAGDPWTEFLTRKLHTIIAGCEDDRAAVVADWRQYRAITNFLVLGPFPNVGGSGLSVAYAPEHEIDLDATYHDRIGRPVRWQVVNAAPRGLLDFDMLFDDEPDAIGYALTYVHLDQAMNGAVHLSGKGTSVLWVNGELKHVDDEPRVPGGRYFDVPVTFREGWNRILLKSGAERDQLGWHISVRDPDGLPMDVEQSTDPRVYESTLPAEVELGDPGSIQLPHGINVFSEEHFMRRWYESADELRFADFVRLAVYLKENGLADEADAVLEIGETRFPNSGILDLCRADMLDFRERPGEAMALRREVAQRSPILLEATASMMFEMSSQGDEDEVMRMLDGMQLQSSTGHYERMLWASLLIRRGRVVEGVAELQKLFREAPGDKAIRSTYLGILEMAGRIREYEEGMATAVAARPDDMVLLRQYAALAYERGDYDLAVDTLKRALKFWYRRDKIYMEMSTVLEAAGRTEEAVAALRNALECSPVSVSAHHGLASALLKLDRKDEALEHLQVAAERDPYSLTLRTTIRQAKGLPPLSDYFTKEDVSELAAADISWIEGEAEAIRLVDASDIIVYSDGAHSIRHHTATKVLDASGVEEFSRIDTPVFWDASQGQIEIARTIKADGREIDAERGYGEIAFSDVEPGDIVEYRYTVRFAPEIGLKGHFWDQHYFQFGIPCVLSRLSILSDESIEYEWVSHNRDIERAVTEQDDGWILSVWEARDVPRDAVEIDMPAAEERIAWVDVSTINSWDDVVEWYDSQSRGRVRAGEGVKALASELAEGAKDDSTRIHRVAHHVMTEIRYEGGQFSGSANVPRAAEEVLRTGFGDCKDQSCLMISLLREMGVAAQFALVNSRDVITVPYLPSPRFTHAIVRAVTSDGRVFWVDPTAEGLAFPNVPVSLEGAKALLVDPEHPEFVTLDVEPAATNGYESAVRGVLEPSGRMHVTASVAYRGEDASGFRMLMHAMPAYRDQVGEMIVTEPHPGAVIESAELDASGDPDTPVAFSCEFSLAAGASRAGDLLILNVPWTIGGAPLDMVSSDDREEPLVLDSWKGRYVETVEIVLPDGCAPIEGLASVETACEHGAFSLTRALNGNVLTLVNTLQIDTIRIEPGDYGEFRKMIETAWRAEQEPIVLRMSS